MAEFKNSLPVWRALGIEPPLSKTERGWKIDERPPADYMNYLQNKTYESIRELQENAVHKDTFKVISDETTIIKQKAEDNEKQITKLQQQVSTGGSGVLSFNTLSDLQNAFPNGSDKPVWIVSENSWYYWEGTNVPDTKPPNVTASPNGGTFSSSQNVVLIADEAATIFYTLDGSTPTTSSAVYSSPIAINTTKTLKFFGKDSAGNVSAVQSLLFTINTGGGDTSPPIVTASPNGGVFPTSQQVTLSSNETAVIYYTLDGSTPTVSSTVYSSPITISSTTTLKFIGKDTAGNVSTVQSVTFTKQPVTTFPILDSFNRADNTILGNTDTGQVWTQFSSANGTVTYGIQSNKLYASGGTDARLSGKFRRQATLNIPSNNFSIECKTVIPAYVGGNVSIGLRYKGDNDLIYVSYQTEGVAAASRYTINKIPYGGSVSKLATGTVMPKDGDQIKICHYQDGKIDVFVNGVLDCTTNDTMNLTATTTIGIGTDTTNCGIDDLKIDVLP